MKKYLSESKNFSFALFDKKNCGTCESSRFNLRESYENANIVAIEAARAVNTAKDLR